MSDNPQDPFSMFDLGGLLGSAGDPWRRAAEIAGSLAAEGLSEPNVDPIVRRGVEELARIAELNVQAHPLVEVPAGTTFDPVTRAEWARRSLKTYRPFLERFLDSLGAHSSELSSELDEVLEQSSDDPMAGLWGQMMRQVFDNLGPMLIITMAGSMVGHLAQRALGSYDLPIPRERRELLIVPDELQETAAEWDTDPSETSLWVLTNELVTHAVVHHPHVRARLESLVLDYASAFQVDPERLASQLDLDGIAVDPTSGMPDLSQLQNMAQQLNDPDRLLASMSTPAQELMKPQFDALLAAVLGFVDHVTTQIMTGLTTDPAGMRDRFHQRLADTAPADQFMNHLFGIELTPELLARGERFIDGVLERAGEAGLARLWRDELDLPTAAEVDAPGLWLARIGMVDDGVELPEIPDDLSGLDEL